MSGRSRSKSAAAAEQQRFVVELKDLGAEYLVSAAQPTLLPASSAPCCPCLHHRRPLPSRSECRQAALWPTLPGACPLQKPPPPDPRAGRAAWPPAPRTCRARKYGFFIYRSRFHVEHRDPYRSDLTMSRTWHGTGIECMEPPIADALRPTLVE
ncbi:hypothetical protein BAE44_0004056 [Dichanthelium oligosanthes]|uniref:Uncharacterized protein n=1 Tax=Dichanthelium oligosanthes TaxID=888268 RepID=A0A1E5WC31_9POAL|nr:hypothetical protein BAE44_0004056 [Dichanthelium oligosanthes]